MFNMMAALWGYRYFVFSSIRNEFVSRFARSKLGGLWMILHPLSQVAIFALVLSNVLAAKLPGVDTKGAYALYLMAGTLAWNLFAELIGRCLTVFLDNGSILKKVRFPRIALPAIVVGSCLLNNILLFLSILVIFAFLGHNPGIQVLWVPLLSLGIVALSLGIGLILGVLNVFVRDIGQVVPVLLQLLFWFTPIVYPVSVIPEEYRGYLVYNPMYAVVTAFQGVLVYNTMPSFDELVVIFLLSLMLLLMGLFLFRRASPELVDAL